MRVLIAGGGTGGHVIPALAIARELRDQHGAQVRFVGTARGLETRLVPEAGFWLELIRVGQLKNVSLGTRLRTLVDLPLGVERCRRLLREFRPQVVIGVGGYASGPAMMAAILMRIPTLAFEPNAVPGLANRLVGRLVSAAAVNFEATRSYFRNAQVTGIPVRREFFAILPSDGRSASLRLLVFGGSQGAKVFNETMPSIARVLLGSVPGLTILHQCGARHLEATESAYRASGAEASRWRVAAFLDDMPKRFAEADLILCRSGASTVAELAAAGRASVLVPFPGAADDHQRLNAEEFAKSGGAVVLIEEAGPQMPPLLFQALSGLLKDPHRCALMAARARAGSRPGAAEAITAMCVGLARS